MIFKQRINASNFTIYAIKMYENPDKMTDKEVNKDLKRFSYIGKLLRRYYSGKTIQLQLLLNHFVILHNLFGPVPMARLLYFYLDEAYHPAIKTILQALCIEHGRIPEVAISRVKIDKELLQQLGEL